MIAPRPRTAADADAPTPAALLALRADELNFQLPMGYHHTAVQAHSLSAHYQNELREVVCDDQDGCGDRPPKYTRHSHYSVHPHPHSTSGSNTYTHTHASQPSTSSMSSSSSSSTAAHSMSSATTARPSLDSLDKREPESASAHVHTHPAQPQLYSHECTTSEDIPAPPYTSTSSPPLPNPPPSGDLNRTSLTALQAASFPGLDSLDTADDRVDPDAIVQRRLTRNALLARQSAITFASSVWGADEPPPLPSSEREQRESTYTTYSYTSFDPARASVQTYGSSVLTYGSPTDRTFPSSSSPEERERPVAPLPWLPRPSALERIHSQAQSGRARSGSMGSTSSVSSGANGGGRRPLPPLPTPTSTTRDRSVSLPVPPPSSPSSHSSYSQATNSPSISSYSILNASSSGGKRPRPLPRTPSMLSTLSGTGLPDITEGEVSGLSEPSWGPVRTERSSMFLSPTDGPSGFGNIGMKGRRGASARYSTIGYGHVARANVRNAFLFGDDESENAKEMEKGVPERKENASRASTRSTYFVPDVDELVRILDSMDDGSEESVPSTPVAGAARPAAPRGEKMTFVREDLSNKQANNIGLLTPAATPRSSPNRLPSTLPSNSTSHSKSKSTPRKQGTEPEIEVSSPAPTSAGALSLTSFPLPPPAPLYIHIPAPGALGAADMPIPSGSAVSFSSLLGEDGKSHAEMATLSGMEAAAAAQRHMNTRDAIKDLRERVSGLPSETVSSSPPKKNQGLNKFTLGVPLLSLPIPPRRRTQSTTTATPQPQPPSSAARKPPAIDIRAANALPPPSEFGTSKTGSGLISSGATSAPAHGLVFSEESQRPTIIYTTPAPAPSVAPLRIRRASAMSQVSKKASQGKGQTLMVHVPPPPPAPFPQSASAMQTSFDIAGSPPSAGRAQRAASVCVSPGLVGSVAPLRLRNSKIGGGPRARSSTIGQTSMPVHVQAPLPPLKKSGLPTSEVDASEESESDQLTTPTSCEAPATPLTGVVEPEEGCGTGLSSLSAIERANGTIDPAFADIIKSISGGSEEEQMGSLLTLASSINTNHHTSGYNAGFSVPFLGDEEEGEGEFVDVEEEEGMGRKETARRSVASSEKRRSKAKKRQSTRSAAAVRAAIRALPDPSTFPIPDSGGSVATDGSAAAAGSDYSNFMRPSPLPRLKLVTKFKGGSVLLPASQAPLSAASTKSGMSSMSGYSSHSRRASGVSIARRSSAVAGPRKLNRLTLTDPRSPMADAAIAAATLVARVRQKRAALAQRGIGPNGIPLREGGGGGHRRTNSGSSGTLRSKLKMSGGGFFGGSSVRAIADPAAIAVDDTTKAVTSTVAGDGVLRSGPRAQRPTIRRARMNRTSVALSHNGDPTSVGNLDLY